LGISRSAPFTLRFDQPARLFRGGSLVTRAYDNQGRTTETSLAVALEGAQGFVPIDVRWALPYISEAEQGSSRRPAKGTRVLPQLAFIGADPVPGASRRLIRGYSGTGTVEFRAPGAFVQWSAKTREGGAARHRRPVPLAPVPSTPGGTVRLPDQLAGHYGVVLVNRGAWCSFCTGQLTAFPRASAELEAADVSLVSFSTDDGSTASGLVSDKTLTSAADR